MANVQILEGAPDPRQLLRLAQDRSVHARRALVNTITDVFADRSSGMSEHEHALMNEILAKLVREFEMNVRRELAERLAARKSAPHDLIVVLANDEIEVARPILRRSTLLQTPELIEIIKNRTQEHQLSIAMRRSVSEIVSDALVETGNSDVITTLLQNDSAQITDATLSYLVDQAQRVDSYQEPLVRRRDLPIPLARKMYRWVSAALRSHILENFDIDPFELDDELEQLSGASGDEQDSEVGTRSAHDLAERLHAGDQITPELLIQCLRRGEIVLFEAMFEQISGLTSPRLQRVLYEPSGKDLAIAARALEIGRSHFSLLFLLTRKRRSGESASDPRAVARAMSSFDQIAPEGARQVLRHWQRSTDYLDAIEEIEERRDGPAPD